MFLFPFKSLDFLDRSPRTLLRTNPNNRNISQQEVCNLTGMLQAVVHQHILLSSFPPSWLPHHHNPCLPPSTYADFTGGLVECLSMFRPDSESNLYIWPVIWVGISISWLGLVMQVHLSQTLILSIQTPSKCSRIGLPWCSCKSRCGIHPCFSSLPQPHSVLQLPNDRDWPSLICDPSRTRLLLNWAYLRLGWFQAMHLTNSPSLQRSHPCSLSVRRHLLILICSI